jgi:hypothetical protein
LIINILVRNIIPTQHSQKFYWKIAPVTGTCIYKPEYIECMREAGTLVELSPTQKAFSVGDIQASRILG